MNINQLIANLESLEKLATPGNWLNTWEEESLLNSSLHKEILISGPGELGENPVIAVEFFDNYHISCTREDARLICEMRNNLIALLTELRQLQEYAPHLKSGSRVEYTVNKKRCTILHPTRFKEHWDPEVSGIQWHYLVAWNADDTQDTSEIAESFLLPINDDAILVTSLEKESTTSVICLHISELSRSRYTPEGIARLAYVIKATLQKQNWSEREFAKKTGVSHVTVNKYVRGIIGEPQQKILEAFAPYLLKTQFKGEALFVDPVDTYGRDWMALDKIASSPD